MRVQLVARMPQGAPMGHPEMSSMDPQGHPGDLQLARSGSQGGRQGRGAD